MNRSLEQDSIAEQETLVSLGVRGLIGGTLMGLANLVPGISGGTMLLATGVYTQFVRAVADVSTFRFRLPSLVLLGFISLSGVAAIAFLAGPVKELVVHQRWIMYSIFIGLTLGGVPLVWRLARPVNAVVACGLLAGVLVMVLVSIVQPGGGGGSNTSYGMLFLGGLCGAAAMVLPGISGGYLLLVLGQYVPILASVSRFKDAVFSLDLDGAIGELHIVVPVGLGVILGVAGVSNAVRWLLKRYEKLTLGVLLGLLCGAVIGLYPFQRGVAPEPGELFRGKVMTAALIAQIDADDYPTKSYQPSPLQVAGSAVLIGLGLACTLLIARLGGSQPESSAH